MHKVRNLVWSHGPTTCRGDWRRSIQFDDVDNIPVGCESYFVFFRNGGTEHDFQFQVSKARISIQRKSSEKWEGMNEYVANSRDDTAIEMNGAKVPKCKGRKNIEIEESWFKLLRSLGPDHSHHQAYPRWAAPR